MKIKFLSYSFFGVDENFFALGRCSFDTITIANFSKNPPQIDEIFFGVETGSFLDEPAAQCGGDEISYFLSHIKNKMETWA